MTPRLWQRQPGESPADFTAFAAYLRLKGRRSHRATAELSGRSLGAIRRLSAKYNWPGRVAAFENRLADATQDALDSVVRAAISTSKSDLEQFRIKEFLLAHQIIHASHRWLQLATNPRRHQISLTQICRLTELAFKLKCLATGMPFGDEPRRRKRPEDRPGYWTGPSVEEALQKIYGDNSPAAASLSAASRDGCAAPPAPAPASPHNHPSSPSAPSAPASSLEVDGSMLKVEGSPPAPAPASAPNHPSSPSAPPPRCDVWRRLNRQLRRQQEIGRLIH